MDEGVSGEPAEHRFSRGMSARYTGILLLMAALAVLAASAGCLATAIGEVTYDGEALQVAVENSGEPVENAVLQVKIMEVDLFEQQKVFSQARHINLDSGENNYSIEVDLQPGTYRAFLNIFIDDERGASVIRDLEVAV